MSKMNKDKEQSYHDLLKENKELKEWLDTLEEKIVGDGLEYLLENKRQPPYCDCCKKRDELTQHYDNYYEMYMMFCKDCIIQK